MSKNSGDIFNGFSREMSDFLVELRFNNNREWFDNNRERYFSLLKEPMDSFAREMNAELCRRTGIKTIPSVSRINRDIRFSKNKEPYRDHRWVVFKRDTGEWKHKPVHSPVFSLAWNPNIGHSHRGIADNSFYRYHLVLQLPSFP